MLDEIQKPTAYFLGGTIVLDHLDQTITPPTCFEWHNAKWRCPAVHYRTIRNWLYEQNIRNSIPRWRDLTLTLDDKRDPHPYQTEALQAWQEANRWGSVVLPTGAGKTFLALQAMAACSVNTLVVVPTIDLLHQWYALLENAFGSPIGVWYGQEKQLEPITITTYPSAWAQAELLGNQFKLLIFDEIHHLPAPSWHEIALMCAAPYRLGLTATYPDPLTTSTPPNHSPPPISNLRSQVSNLQSPISNLQSPISNPRSQVSNLQSPISNLQSPISDLQSPISTPPSPAQILNSLVGPVVYRKKIDDLTGQQLAEYRTERIRIDLTSQERADYDNAYAAYTGYVREARLRESHGPHWWDEFTRRSAYEAQARRAKVAEMKLKEIVHQAQGKLDILDRLLREHRHRHMLIFTAHNRFAYRIARHYLIPVITHQTKAAERKAILDDFRAGTYEAIVTSKVLNEGVDVPEAKVAVVLGGSASAREYVQRLGRVLRKKGNAQATLFEIIARKTVDERIARRRRPK